MNDKKTRIALKNKMENCYLGKEFLKEQTKN